jgi:hypothetical protein
MTYTQYTATCTIDNVIVKVYCKCHQFFKAPRILQLDRALAMVTPETGVGNAYTTFNSRQSWLWYYTHQVCGYGTKHQTLPSSVI